MSKFDSRALLRAARYVSDRLAPRPHATVEELPNVAWQQCQRARELVALAQRRGWQAAARSCSDRLRRSLADLRYQLEATTRDAGAHVVQRQASLRDIYDDLTAIEDEFPRLRIDLREQILAVTTPPVVLDGLALGAFEIVLDCERLAARSGAYAVVALEPSPSAVDSSVTHPHVRDETLCEGEAYSALRAALAGGRLLDFFTIVAQTLATYNAVSAYVALDRWGGVSCSDCGYETCEDDQTSCELCSCDLCHDCSAGCNRCSRTLCGECSVSCAGCHECYCTGCLAECSACKRDFCKGCLNDQQCDQCRDEAAQEEIPLGEAATRPAATAGAEASLQPLCLGQADRSA